LAIAAIKAKTRAEKANKLKSKLLEMGNYLTTIFEQRNKRTLRVTPRYDSKLSVERGFIFLFICFILRQTTTGQSLECHLPVQAAIK